MGGGVRQIYLWPMLTVGFDGGVDGVELANVRDERNVHYRGAVVPRVVPRSTRDLVVHGRLEAVLVEEACNPRGGHAPPGVGVGFEKPSDDGNPRVSCRGGVRDRTALLCGATDLRCLW